MSKAVRVQPAWTDRAHFTEARESLLAHVYDADVDLCDGFFRGTLYKFQYGGFSVQEAVGPWLRNCRYEAEADQQQLLGMCFPPSSYLPSERSRI